jgi:phosphoglycolate phosphatase
MIRLLPLIEKKKHIIFDYNGTILYDTDVCVEVINKLLESHQQPPVDEASYREHFHFPISNFYSKIGFDFAIVC